MRSLPVRCVSCCSGCAFAQGGGGALLLVLLKLDSAHLCGDTMTLTQYWPRWRSEPMHCYTPNPPVVLLGGRCWGCREHSAMCPWAAEGLFSSWSHLLMGRYSRTDPVRLGWRPPVCCDQAKQEHSLPFPLKKGNDYFKSKLTFSIKLAIRKYSLTYQFISFLLSSEQAEESCVLLLFLLHLWQVYSLHKTMIN